MHTSELTDWQKQCSNEILQARRLWHIRPDFLGLLFLRFLRRLRRLTNVAGILEPGSKCALQFFVGQRAKALHNSLLIEFNQKISVFPLSVVDDSRTGEHRQSPGRALPSCPKYSFI